MKKRQGFTLLELLIVVVIIGVLALIAAPSLLNAADQARNATVRANISAAASSVTGRFALNPTNLTAAQIATAVVTELNTNNQNPISTANAAFATSGTAAGSVVLASGTNASGQDNITITGYDKGGSLLLTKTVTQP